MARVPRTLRVMARRRCPARASPHNFVTKASFTASVVVYARRLTPGIYCSVSRWCWTPPSPNPSQYLAHVPPPSDSPELRLDGALAHHDMTRRIIMFIPRDIISMSSKFSLTFRFVYLLYDYRI
jgi:hypothetical protein